ncbi:MAG: hypothetical protein Q7V05_00510 [Methanoregula sp.]|nr:hypothetical protein [Methanoregula sp.]
MSTDKIAIRVRGLGKKYTLGGSQEKYHTLRDAIVNSVKAPFNRASSHKSSGRLKDVSYDVDPWEVVGIVGRKRILKVRTLYFLMGESTPF